MSSSQIKFEGWAAVDKTAVEGGLKFQEYEPKTFQNDDIELKILYSGICGSDIHTINQGWGDISQMLPQVVGHEIIGSVLRVGSEVANIKEGDVVGIGAQCDSCLDCEYCHDHRENYCSKGIVGTYNAKFSRGPSAGEKSYGGYANYWRGPAHFAVPIPKGLDLALAAPMMCAGTTVFAPLEQHGAGTTAKDVGVVGVGGLGHFAIMFADKMGANVTAISHGKSKVEDAKKMGAKKVIVTGDDANAVCEENSRSLDLIVSTSNDPKVPLDAYLKLLRPGGTLLFVGAPDAGYLPQLNAFQFIMNNVHIGASLIGSPSTIERMLKFAVKHDVKPWIQKFPMSEVNKAVVSMHKGEARYRIVLVNEENGAKL